MHNCCLNYYVFINTLLIIMCSLIHRTIVSSLTLRFRYDETHTKHSYLVETKLVHVSTKELQNRII